MGYFLLLETYSKSEVFFDAFIIVFHALKRKKNMPSKFNTAYFYALCFEIKLSIFCYLNRTTWTPYITFPSPRRYESDTIISQASLTMQKNVIRRSSGTKYVCFLVSCEVLQDFLQVPLEESSEEDYRKRWMTQRNLKNLEVT